MKFGYLDLWIPHPFILVYVFNIELEFEVRSQCQEKKND